MNNPRRKRSDRIYKPWWLCGTIVEVRIDGFSRIMLFSGYGVIHPVAESVPGICKLHNVRAHCLPRTSRHRLASREGVARSRRASVSVASSHWAQSKWTLFHNPGR